MKFRNSEINYQIIKTDDGSDTLFCKDLNQHYHSTFGAVSESMHIFINAGFFHFLETARAMKTEEPVQIRILEVGFGTGLNALLTLQAAENHGINVHYTGIEAFPLEESCWRSLNYPSLAVSSDFKHIFSKIHLADWNKPEIISRNFTLQKIHNKLEEFFPMEGAFDLIYFDAFSPDAQPELWTGQIFSNLSRSLSPGGMLVTYSVKGTVVRALRSCGFLTEKLPGPPGKRHILRAVRI